MNLDSPELAAAGLSNLINLPCNCHSGTYLDGGSGNCQPCAAGFFNPGGIRMDAEEFSTWEMNYDVGGGEQICDIEQY